MSLRHIAGFEQDEAVVTARDPGVSGAVERRYT
jgi:hypothetical protein